MNSIELIKVLIEQVQQYEQQADDKSGLNVEEFYHFTKEQHSIDSYKNSLIHLPQHVESEKHHHRENSIERVISQHLLFIYRYIKFYSKMVFTNGRMRSVEEFGILITVMQCGSISKSDVIKRNIIDKSSGIEIINRLIKMELLVQYSNPNDQRSQLIRLSELGRMELFQSFESMDKLGKIATGELSTTEKMNLAAMLKKLDHFHYDNYTSKNHKTLDDYLPKSSSHLPSE